MAQLGGEIARLLGKRQNLIFIALKVALLGSKLSLPYPVVYERKCLDVIVSLPEKCLRFIEQTQYGSNRKGGGRVDEWMGPLRSPSGWGGIPALACMLRAGTCAPAMDPGFIPRPRTGSSGPALYHASHPELLDLRLTITDLAQQLTCMFPQTRWSVALFVLDAGYVRKTRQRAEQCT